MKRSKRFSILLFLCICIGGLNATAQKTASQELKQMLDAYDQHKRMQMEVTYKLYGSFSSAVVVESQTGTIKKSGKNQVSVFGNTETLVTPDYMVMVDKEEKMIIIGNPAGAAGRSMSLAQIDSILSSFESVTASENSTQKIFKLREAKNTPIEFEEMDIVIDKKTFLLEKMVFFYREPIKLGTGASPAKPRLEVVFSHINVQAELAAALFLEKNYFTKVKEKYVAGILYPNYKVVLQKL